MDCPSREEYVDCLLGRLAAAHTERLLNHAEQCEACHRLVDGLDTMSDGVTEALRNQDTSFLLAAECDGMIERAKGSLESSPPTATPTTDVRKHLLQGTQVRDYEIIRPLGEGGMGAVFLARHRRLDRDVALKVLSLRRARDVEAQRRFEQEMAIVGKLQHPGIVGALDAGEQDGVQYLVMEVVEGVDLRQLVDALGPIPLADACEIVRQAALALDYAHQQQLIHRDVKPSNIMLERAGGTKLMDLGLARFTDQHRSLTSTQQAMGSLDFMAPEQLQAQDVDRRADIYGLACTLHFLLTGEPPERRRTAALMVARTPRLDSLRHTLPPPLLRLMSRMLATDATKRPSSAAQVADELAPYCHRADLKQLALNAQSSLQPMATEDSGSITSEITEVAAPPARWRRRALVAIAVLATATAAVSVRSWWLTADPPPSPVVLSQLPSVSSQAEPNREIPLFQLHQEAVRCVAWADKSGHLICGSDDGTVSIRDLPHQRKITILCQFEGPVGQVALTLDQQRFACVDQSGTISFLAVEAPPEAGHLIGRLAPATFASPPVDVLVYSAFEQLLIRHADGTLRLYQPETRTTLAKSSVFEKVSQMYMAQDESSLVVVCDDGTRLTFALPSLTPQERGVASEVRLINQRPGESITRSVDIASKTCVADGTLVRLIDPKNLQAQHFVYAEHRHSITLLFAFPDQSLLLTGDQSGEIRLWHAPGQAYSDMLMECEVAVDAAKMTFDIHRKQKWTLAEFENPGPDAVTYAEAAGVMTITTSINRGGRNHVLEYKVDPMPSDNE